MQRRSFELRKSLVVLRRVVLPMREVVNALLRRDLDIGDETLQPTVAIMVVTPVLLYVSFERRDWL